jgi:hypothetical protein
MTYRILVTLVLCFGPVAAHAGEIMFEGYYRIALSGKPIGYVIQRYEFDPKTHQFIAISFQRAKLGGKNVQESLKAVSNDKFQPISYNYTGQVDDTVKTIDGTFKGNIMKLIITDGKKTQRNETHQIPKGTFLSSFLTYIMMQKKLSIGEAFQYSAVAEEDGSSANGKAMLDSKSDHGGYVVFRVINNFLGEKFISNMAAVPDPGNVDKYIKTEVFGSSSPVKNITTELVDSPAKATEGQLVPNKVLLTLFGTMPSGKLNLVATPPTVKVAEPAKKIEEPAPKEK